MDSDSYTTKDALIDSDSYTTKDALNKAHHRIKTL